MIKADIRNPSTGILLDFGGTLVEESAYDERAAHTWLLSRASKRPDGLTIDDVMAKVAQLGNEFRTRAEQSHVEIAWLALTRLVYGTLGVQFAAPIEDLELGFWKLAAKTRPMPGAFAALDALDRNGIPLAVVTNSHYSRHVIRAELSRYDLGKHIAFVIVSSEYGVRKPHPAIFESAARRLGLKPKNLWHIGDCIETDIAGAKAAGMNAIWFRPADAIEAVPPEADDTVRRWADIVALFEKRAA
jgi:putative hydrolase of the HAD superfamily